MNTDIVIGIDGGGTYTRAIAATTEGQILAFAQGGAASPSKTPHAQENVQTIIVKVVTQAQRQLSDVRALVAGIAGIDAPQDQEWAERFTALPELYCPRIHVNDAVVAHAGALSSRPGIIAISGTGSIVFGVTEEGRQVRNYDLRHYAPTAARHLSYNAVYSILAGRAGREDQKFVAEVLAFWETANISVLRTLGEQGFVDDTFERNVLLADMAPLVTAAAERGDPLACGVCDRTAEALATGIQLVGGCFAAFQVPVSLIGSAVRNPYMKQAVAKALDSSTEMQYLIVEPHLSSAAGATLMALQIGGFVVDTAVKERLRVGHSVVYAETVSRAAADANAK